MKRRRAHLIAGRGCGRLVLILLLLLVVTPVSAVDEYRLDDGAKEGGWGSSGGSGTISFAWLNRFIAESGLETITDVRIAFGGGLLQSNHVPNGTPLTIYIWGDFNQDGDPDDAFVLDSIPGLVANTGTNTLNTYAVNPPLTFNVGDVFFVGAIINGLNNPTPPDFVRVGSLDEDGTDSIPNYPPSLHSWVAASNQSIAVDPNNLDLAIVPVDLVSNAFFGGADDGTWMIRLNATGTGGPALMVMPDPLDFGSVATGVTTGPLAVTLTNTGTAQLDIGTIDTAMPPFAWTGAGSCPATPFALTPGQACTLEAIFTPASHGLLVQDIFVTSNAPTSPNSFRLAGRGDDFIFVNGFE